jgi:hypothetical protein
VAVTVAVWLLEIVPLVAPKVAVADPAATVTVAGTVSAGALLDSVMLAPPLGAAWFSVMVQVLEESCPRLVGLQLSEETCTGATRLMLAILETPLRVAVSVAVWLELQLPAVAVELAEVEPAGTVTEAATDSIVLLLDSVTLAPPLGAAWFSVVVQVVEEFGPRLAGLQLSEETCTGAVRLMLAVAEVLL